MLQLSQKRRKKRLKSQDGQGIITELWVDHHISPYMSALTSDGESFSASYSVPQQSLAIWACCVPSVCTECFLRLLRTTYIFQACACGNRECLRLGYGGQAQKVRKEAET